MKIVWPLFVVNGPHRHVGANQPTPSVGAARSKSRGAILAEPRRALEHVCEAEQAWYYTDGTHWFWHDGKAWMRYRFDKKFVTTGSFTGSTRSPWKRRGLFSPVHEVLTGCSAESS